MAAPVGNKNAGKTAQRTAHIDVRLMPAEKVAWQAAAAARGQTMSAMVTEAVAALLETAGK